MFCLIASTHSSLASSQFSQAEKNEHLSGGSHTHRLKAHRDSFLQPSPVLDLDEGLNFKVGQAIFEKIWVFSPSSTTASDGLGPLYNARSCHRCHIRNGRGQEPLLHDGDTNSKSPVSLFLRLSVPATTAEEKAMLDSGKIGFIPEPTYGSQLQTFAYPGGKSEGQLLVRYQTKDVQLNGEVVTLHAPEYQIINLGYGPLHNDLQFSPRTAPPMIGLGLLDTIDASDIKKLADPRDKNQDGISGKINWVWNIEQKAPAIGRFGWKASKPTLKQQNGAALNGDIGISSMLYPNPAGDCTMQQPACHQQPHGNSAIHDGLEASEKMMDLLLHYTRFIAVPPRRDVAKPNVLAGKKLFHEAGCASCHQPSFVTSKEAKPAQLANQKIWPYTDLLLHDMGEGLADHRPEFAANGREWRTPPLWGIGLTKMIGGEQFFLHDARALTLMEAIMWHGGEAESSQQAVKAFSILQRAQLIEFLESL